MCKQTCWNTDLRGINCPYGPEYNEHCGSCGWNPSVESKRRAVLERMDRNALAELIKSRAEEFAKCAEEMKE